MNNLSGGYRDDRRGGRGGGYRGDRGGEESHGNFGMRRDRRDSDRERGPGGRGPPRQGEDFREATAGEVTLVSVAQNINMYVSFRGGSCQTKVETASEDSKRPS